MRRTDPFKSLFKSPFKSLLQSLSAAVLLAGLGAASAAHAGSAGQLAPIADFFRKPLIGNPTLSPDGKLLAAITTQGEGRGRLAVIDLADPTKSKILVSDPDADITNPRWVNNHRLLYSVAPNFSGVFTSHGPGLWAVDVDTPGIRTLISPSWNSHGLRTAALDRTLSADWHLQAVLRDNSDDVIVAQRGYSNVGEFSQTAIERLDTRTGLSSKVVNDFPPNALGWWLDTNGHVLAVSTLARDKRKVLIPEGNGWTVVSESNAYTDDSGLAPMRGDGQGRLWMKGPDPEHQTDADVLQWLDLKHPEKGNKVLLNLPGYDFDGSLVLEQKSQRLIGVRYETDARSTLWLDPSMKALQAEIDAKLPGTVNEIYCEVCLNQDMVLVISSSGQQPPVYSRYERSSKTVTLLFQTRPWVDASQQGRREFTSFKARDGMTIPVLVTFPAGPPAKKRPAVVLVRHDPWSRNAFWAWEPDAQFLASRGYVVIEPEFRGSRGYGSGLFRAGFKQWGLTMQDDISDSMDWAAKNGWIDAKRTCIGGFSYGGYAVLMGLAKEPERYRCGFEWGGISDINLMYDINWTGFTDAYKTYGLPTLVGDQIKDRAQLKATSPIEQAAYINKPVLMAYGGVDGLVPYKYGKAMQSALEEAGNRNVEWVFYPDEGHGWYKLEDNVDWWGRVERFLAKNTAPAAAQ
ncbi:MAG TPA: prolyl oligopeptidase family serine peptidase [Burkholderiaceae bacterium]